MKKKGVFDIDPDRPREKTERDIRNEISNALSRIDGVWIHVNTIVEGEMRPREGQKRGDYIKSGLGDGSPDMVGSVSFGAISAWPPYDLITVARSFYLELKSKARHVSEEDALSDDQITWHAMMRRMGGFVAVVWSAEEAVAAVERCRRGERE